MIRNELMVQRKCFERRCFIPTCCNYVEFCKFSFGDTYEKILFLISVRIYRYAFAGFFVSHNRHVISRLACVYDLRILQAQRDGGEDVNASFFSFAHTDTHTYTLNITATINFTKDVDFGVSAFCCWRP